MLFRSWSAETIKNAIGVAARLKDVVPDSVDERAGALRSALKSGGWKQKSVDAGFGDVQPRYVYTVSVAGKSDDELLTGFNQLWRRNLKKAEKAGVSVRQGNRTDLSAFHAVYLETAARDGFTPRPLGYFERYWDALSAQPDQIGRAHV